MLLLGGKWELKIGGRSLSRVFGEYITEISVSVLPWVPFLGKRKFYFQMSTKVLGDSEKILGGF